ncbi:septum site-determining protein MinD [Succinatimonas hippei]|uniref:Septum site-determining protein MinD n=1 Tax=Succinatimonas hippei (strain DSM 22608 / JCM 16073 / KCTC 15190 / YIT 12066) TaxID=762983 RepID=E8LMH3_SUCHY|nr:septum site-determining protein MinD [Succinatimonas hippei]EFY06265.1 septum site-determining protein MinD [Succinatimonas hippei YIT 12066]MCL1603397.1 septum site-determining protein MinD [Succinatimonas hippei]MDM8121094.1 septum site-determining protein MinD [Succinatimonas hippei]
MSEIKNEVEKTNEEVKDLASTVKDETAAAEVTTEDKAAEEEEVKAAEQTAEKTDTEKKSGPDLEPFNCRIIVVTSGKGGVGKTTSSAAIATGLALKGHKTAVIDFDVGLRNLDLVMGCERRVVYDLINVVHKEARLNQALIKDRHVDNLYILPASQTKDKDALTLEGVGEVLRGLDNAGFEYVVCDSPAGIEAGALMALYYADEAVVTTNPEVSSVRDSDRIIGILNSKSRRAVLDWEPVTSRLLLTRYVPGRVTKNEMLSVEDVQELLTIPLLGVIPESPDVLKASNAGNSIILNKESDAGKAYEDAVERLLGNEVELRFTTEKKGFFSKLFKR